MKSLVRLIVPFALLGALVASSLAFAADKDTLLVTEGDEAFRQSMSDDGRYVAYISDESGQALRKDLKTGEEIIVSRHEGGARPNANDVIESPMLSSTGRYVAFGSTDQDLDEDYDDGFPTVSVTQIFVYDVVNDETTLVSRADGPDGKSVGSFAQLGGISDDGRYVAFSSGDDLGTGSTTFGNFFRRDLQENETDLTSRDDDETPVEPAESPSISGDGKFVTLPTFEDLAGDDADGQLDAYRRDVENGETIMVSRTAGGAPIPGGGINVRAISADGSKMLLLTDEPLDAVDTNDDTDTYLRDEAASTLTLVSRKDGANGGVGDGDSFPAGPEALSPDGRFVGFGSRANLDPADDGSERQIYMRDVLAGATILASRPDGSSAGAGNSDSGGSSVAANGGFIAFTSTATNLNASDGDPDSDVYRRELSPTGPTLSGTDPSSPADDQTPLVTGTAQPGSTVRIHGAAGASAAADECPGVVIGSGSADGSG